MTAATRSTFHVLSAEADALKAQVLAQPQGDQVWSVLEPELRDLAAVRRTRSTMARLRLSTRPALWIHPALPTILTWRDGEAAQEAARAVWRHCWGVTTQYAAPLLMPPRAWSPSPGFGVKPMDTMASWWLVALQLAQPVDPASPPQVAWQDWAIRLYLDRVTDAGVSDPTAELPAWARLTPATQQALVTRLLDPTLDLESGLSSEAPIARREVAGLALTGEALRTWGEHLATPGIPLPPGFWALAYFDRLVTHVGTQPRDVVAPFLRWPNRTWRLRLLGVMGDQVTSASAPKTLDAPPAASAAAERDAARR